MAKYRMVEFPPGEPQDVCAICGKAFTKYDPEFASNYANLVYEACDDRAVTDRDVRPKVGSEFVGQDSIATDEDGNHVIQLGPDAGDNPVFIDGQQCWRRYRFGGWITRRDDHDCESLEEFHRTHRQQQ